MHFHPKQQHTQQRAGQNQGHRERDHGAGAKAEAQKADEQHRRQGLEEGAREFADGGLDHARLISDPLRLRCPTGSPSSIRLMVASSAFPSSSTSPVLFIVTPRPMTSLPLKRILNSGRVDVAPSDLGKIADAQGSALDPHGKVRHALHRVEGAGES